MDTELPIDETSYDLPLTAAVRARLSLRRGDFGNQLSFLLLAVKLALSGRQQWLKNRSLIVRESECTMRTNFHWHLIPLIIPSPGAQSPWQQCEVTFLFASMPFHQKYPGIGALRPALCFVTTDWNSRCGKWGWWPKHQGRLLANHCCWTEVEPKGEWATMTPCGGVRKLTACSELDEVVGSLGL